MLSCQQNAEDRDEVLDDIVSNRVGKLKGFLDRCGSVNDYLHAAINAGSIDGLAAEFNPSQTKPTLPTRI